MSGKTTPPQNSRATAAKAPGFAERGQPALVGTPPSGVPAGPTPPAPTQGQGERHLLKLGPDGRVLIPADVRKAMRLRDGDTLVAVVEPDGELRLWGTEVGLAKLRMLAEPYMPEGSVVDAFLKDRREMWGGDDA